MEEEKSFSELFEESVSVPARGTVLPGTIVRIDKQDVFIDFGFKSEGVVPLEDFNSKNGEVEINIGDQVEVVLENSLDDDALPRLSKKKADLAKENLKLQEAYRTGSIVIAHVKSTTKNGLVADIGEKTEVRGFIPSSQIDLRPVRDPASFVGKELETKIVKISPTGVVISRRVFLEELQKELRIKTLATLEEGKLVKGKVVNLIDKGAFVDLGGIEGFIPFSELSWGRLNHPKDVLSRDDEIEVLVINFKPEEGRITLSYKRTQPDPWENIGSKYTTGGVVSGKAVSTKEFGVFVELEPGVDGLVHSSEITWTENFKHPKEVVTVGSPVDVIVLGVDAEKKRISLSLKQIQPSPWDIFKEATPPGSRIKGSVKNVTDRGVFIEVEEGIVGLMRPGDIDWKGKVDPAEHFSTGAEIEVVVLNVDPKNQRIALGVKQLTEDPWRAVEAKLKPNRSIVKAKIMEIKPNGAVVELEEGIEGFIRTSELSLERGGDASSRVKVGDEVTAMVIGLDRARKQVSLSRNRHEKRQEKESLEGFMTKQSSESLKIGDVFGDKLRDMILKG